jgi:hypothetical protein
MMRRAFIALAAANALSIASVRAASQVSADSAKIVDGVRLARIHHDQMLLPDPQHAGFGSLLFDEKGELVLHDGTISDRPDGIFKAVHHFKIEATDAWEKAAGQIDSLESYGAHSLIEETDAVLTL